MDIEGRWVFDIFSVAQIADWVIEHHGLARVGKRVEERMSEKV